MDFKETHVVISGRKKSVLCFSGLKNFVNRFIVQTVTEPGDIYTGVAGICKGEAFARNVVEITVFPHKKTSPVKPGRLNVFIFPFAGPGT